MIVIEISEEDVEQIIKERDEAIEWADKLAYLIAPRSVIGGHSSSNNPWKNAADYLEYL
jgi:hypothetical protein